MPQAPRTAGFFGTRQFTAKDTKLTKTNLSNLFCMRKRSKLRGE